MRKSFVLGVVLVLVVALGGGFGLQVLAAKIAMGGVGTSPPPRTEERLRIVRTAGEVEVLGRFGQWMKAREGLEVDRPTAVRASGFGAVAELRYDRIRLLAQHGANVSISTRDSPIAFELDEGNIVVRAPAAHKVETTVPRWNLRVAGTAYGIWMIGERVTIAVLDEQAELVDGEGRSKAYAKGREIVIDKKGETPSVVEPRLEMHMRDSSPRGSGVLLNGRTWPNAVLLLRENGTYRRLDLSQIGYFSAAVSAATPAEGELVAYDAAGRSAEIGRPSATLDELLSDAPVGSASRGSEPPKMEAAPAVPNKDAPSPAPSEKDAAHGAQRSNEGAAPPATSADAGR